MRIQNGHMKLLISIIKKQIIRINELLINPVDYDSL